MGKYCCICALATIDFCQRNTLIDASFLSTDQDSDVENEDETNLVEGADEAEGEDEADDEVEDEADDEVEDEADDEVEDEADDEVERNDVTHGSSKFRRIVKNILSENEQDRKKAYNEATSATLQDIASLLLLSTGDNMKKRRIYEEIIRKVDLANYNPLKS